MAGEVTRKPNVIQRFLHRFFMLRPVTDFFAPRVHKLDNLTLKLTREKYTAVEILGWNVIQLTTIGAKSKQPRKVPLVGIFDGNRIALIASSFGRQHNPNWYYNLKANPQCEVLFRGKSAEYVARETVAMEREKYRERAAHRNIPVMLLEPKN
jgi:deazaflavin-dependent oxidoreductase (nitroreductase family)